MTLVILAAGVGRRYGGLKQLAPVGPQGEALLEYSLYDAARAGFERAVLVVRPETEELFRRRLDPAIAPRIELAYVHQTLSVPGGKAARFAGRSRPWGTGHALLAAADRVAAPFAVINADDFYGEESFTTLARFLRSADDSAPPRWALVGFRLEETLSAAGPVSRALCRLGPDGRLRGLVELAVERQGGRILGSDGSTPPHELEGDERVSMNMWGFTPAVFPVLRQGFEDFLREGDADGEYLLPEAVGAGMRADRASVEVLTGARRWCGITFPADEARTTATLASLTTRGRYPRPLWSGRA